MGYDNYVYIGPYFKVYLPEVDRTDTICTCTKEDCEKHGKYLRDAKFCGTCGSPIDNCTVKVKSHLNIFDFMEEHIGSDVFSIVHQENISSHEPNNFCIIIPNNTKKQGGLSKDAGSCGVYSLPALDRDYFMWGDWKPLRDKLYENKILIEEEVGCILYAR